MNGLTPQASLEDVLESFSVESEVGAATLKRYLGAYPAFAADLIDLSREISRTTIDDAAPLSVDDQRLIGSAITRIQIAPGKAAMDPLANLSAQRMREISKALSVPRQVVLAFQERAVIGASVPQRFLNQFAALMQYSAQQLLAALAQPQAAAKGSYKSERRPNDEAKVTFEQVLRNADLSDGEIAALMEDGP